MQKYAKANKSILVEMVQSQGRGCLLGVTRPFVLATLSAHHFLGLSYGI